MYILVRQTRRRPSLDSFNIHKKPIIYNVDTEFQSLFGKLENQRRLILKWRL